MRIMFCQNGMLQQMTSFHCTISHNTSSQYLLIEKETKTCLFTFISPLLFNNFNL
jgi:hypothetical protein